MEETVLEAYAEVRASLYGLSADELRGVAKEALPGPAFSIKEASRAKLLHALDYYLNSLEKESEHGLSIVLELKTKLLDVTAKTGLASVKVEPVVAELKSSSGGTTDGSKVWRKDFKMTGMIGDSSSCLSYMSFLRQVEVAKDKGYKDSEIIDGIIRAVQPGCRLRGYIEGREDLNLPSTQAIVRSFYHEKSSTELYQELCNLSQGSKETCQDFLLRGLELRQKINFASKEATDFSYDRKLVEKQLHHSLITGIRDESVKYELDTLLRNYSTDEKLLESVNEMVRRQKERDSKFGKLKVHNLKTDDSEVLRELKALRVEVNELKSKYANQQAQSGVGNGPKKTRNSCENCAKTNSWCKHCYKCGSSEHYQYRCPENSEGSLQGKGEQ